MTLIGEQVLLRVYLDSADRTPHTPTYDRLVRAARHDGLAGCTVHPGLYGFGPSGESRPTPWAIVRHHPVIVEFVDTPDCIATFVRTTMSPLMTTGLATLERAAVIRYRHRQIPASSFPAPPSAIEPLSSLPQMQPEPNMTIDDTGVLLRIFIGQSDRAEGRPLHEAIIQKARELGLAGATVLRGSEGFGAHSVVHKSHLLETSSDLPIVIEIVDQEPRIKELLPHLDHMIQEGLITLENVRILTYRPRSTTGVTPV